MQNAFPILSAGVTLSQWHPTNLSEASAIRTFCLQMVKQVYGFDYNPNWHLDLDSLLEGEGSHYAPSNRGCMLILKNEENEIIGTAGMRGLYWKPNMVEMFANRYGDCQYIASNWRMYIRADYRKQGMGKPLVALREIAALRYGYTTMYLHCDISATRLRNHWETLGFTNFCTEGTTAHYDKPLAAASPQVKAA